MAFFESTVSGEYIDTLADKSFVVLKGPAYEEQPDLDNPDKMKRKLKMFVRIGDGSERDYYPNKTSGKTMELMWGGNMDNWIGKKFQWNVVQQQVRKELKKVLFVIEEKVEENSNKRKKNSL